jgi:hypothetical protein
MLIQQDFVREVRYGELLQSRLPCHFPSFYPLLFLPASCLSHENTCLMETGIFANPI